MDGLSGKAIWVARATGEQPAEAMQRQNAIFIPAWIDWPK